MMFFVFFNKQSTNNSINCVHVILVITNKDRNEGIKSGRQNQSKSCLLQLQLIYFVQIDIKHGTITSYSVLLCTPKDNKIALFC